MTPASRLIALLIGALTLATSTPSALAHTDAPHPDALKAAHGGQLAVAGAYRYELVVTKDARDTKESPLTVYVTDHAGHKISTSGASGNATILSGKLKTNAPLTSDGENRMKGVTAYTATSGLKVVISITLAGKSPEQARFTPLAGAQDGHVDHKH